MTADIDAAFNIIHLDERMYTSKHGAVEELKWAKERLIDGHGLSAFLSCLVNSTNPFGVSPLNAACRFGHLDCARYLIEHCNANISQIATEKIKIFAYHSEERTETGRFRGTSLHAAVMSGNLDLIRYLVETRQANVGPVDRKKKEN